MNITDPIVARYLLEYSNPVETERESKEFFKARVLRSLIRYLKKKAGGLDSYIELLSPLIAEFEDKIDSYPVGDFLYISETIAYARKSIRVQKRDYGAGLRRLPSGADLKRVKRISRRVSHTVAGSLEDSDQTVGSDSDFVRNFRSLRVDHDRA